MKGTARPQMKTPDAQTKGPEAVHCYAACRPDITLPEGPGVAGASVRLLADGPVAILVSSLPADVQPGDPECLAAHARVVQQAFEAGVVAPFRFPTIVPSLDETVHELVGPHRDWLLETLDRLEGLEELRLRVRYDEDAAVAEVMSANPWLAKLRGRTDTALRLGEAVVAELRHQAVQDSQAILAAIRPLIEDAMVDAVGGERDVLTASLLIRRGHAQEVDEAAERWAAERPPVQIQLLGPLPPYSFADMEKDS